ncbi:MAG: 4Fe-4S ferredoxin [Chloroflexi bacterium HGW-Chloroflexi-5]|nr:MAG: 4Fe-4S ferredoxin [Chloroflexi bacterium HGW-Chloroflexi-5]
MESKCILFPKIIKSKCTQCGVCVLVCPTNTLQLVSQFPEININNACNTCFACENSCPTGAISIPFSIGWSQA